MSLSELKSRIAAYHFVDEQSCVDWLLSEFKQTPLERQDIQEIAARWIENIRREKHRESILQSFMQEYDLSSPEGVVLMCLAESLLRIPDTETAHRLIEDKLGNAAWNKHLGQSRSFWVNASSWGLVLSGKWMRFTQETRQKTSFFLKRLLAGTGETMTRFAIQKAMTWLGEHFVMGKTLQEALRRANLEKPENTYYSFDMLGEAALTKEDARRFLNAYEEAIQILGQLPESLKKKVSISIKLSALHPRYEVIHRERVFQELTPALLRLILMARDLNIAVTMDAEESARLMLSLDIFERLYRDPALAEWHGLGLVIQTYQKRAVFVIDWLIELAKTVGKTIPVRLVKGAYWDSEIKRAQQLGLENYPLFTCKEATDLAYLVCAQKLLDQPGIFYPQFATHNAHTIASILVYAKSRGFEPFEFQRLHGMGAEIYNVLAAETPIPCRVYAPVGRHKELLPYLIRRLLENGANSSFVHYLTDKTKPVSELIREPSDVLQTTERTTKLPLPTQLFGRERQNSLGFDLNAELHVESLRLAIEPHLNTLWLGGAWVDGQCYREGDKILVLNPASRQDVCGELFMTPLPRALKALESASQAFPIWMGTPVQQRANILNEMANLLEQRRGALISLCIREAGKTWEDAVGEVREAVDFCRYYAAQATRLFAEPILLKGVTGEDNFLSWEGRGIFLCISPWNFPLAIFVGQVAAALVAGNTVLAKPAEQTSLMACYVTTLFHEAGIPQNVLHCLPGEGASLGDFLTQDPRIAGVVFTGSTETAHIIHKNLALREGPIVPLIAETGGQNAMIVDSSALSEQVVQDVLESAFNSAGQRCSALRVLFLQEEIADSLLQLLVGALSEWTLGDPRFISTDIGPVIDGEAQATLLAYVDTWRTRAKFFYQLPLPENTAVGYFVAPTIIEIDNMQDLKREVFGPILHIIRYSAKNMDSVIDAINQTGYGLTLGIHSRIETTVHYLKSRIRVGNVYVNRNMIGAVVGVQPFGGLGLSGTGPKAGGPHYLFRFATERTVTINTAAIGGNVRLLTE